VSFVGTIMTRQGTILLVEFENGRVHRISEEAGTDISVVQDGET
jgi:hypothetical protein